MRILPVTQNKYQYNFKSNANWVCDNYGKQLYKTTTYYFRDDLDWENLIKFICNRYKDVPKVNFINHACSNGMEPLSFLMALYVYAPDFVQKFTPIIAKDINENNIFMAKNGICGASSDDFLRAHKLTKGKIKDFLTLTQAKNSKDLFVLSPQKILQDKIIFEQGDILKDISNIPEENTFLCCRNFWMYLTLEQREKLAYLMGRHLGEKSTVLLGYLDTLEAKAGILLEKNGFKRCKTGSEYVNIMYSKD